MTREFALLRQRVETRMQLQEIDEAGRELARNILQAPEGFQYSYMARLKTLHAEKRELEARLTALELEQREVRQAA